MHGTTLTARQRVGVSISEPWSTAASGHMQTWQAAIKIPQQRCAFETMNGRVSAASATAPAKLQIFRQHSRSAVMRSKHHANSYRQALHRLPKILMSAGQHVTAHGGSAQPLVPKAGCSHAALADSRLQAAATDLLPQTSSSEAKSGLQVIIVGCNAAGLATSIGLSKIAHCCVEVFDSRPDPTQGKTGTHSGLLIALGARGIAALNNLGVTCDGDSSFSDGSTSTAARHSRSANSGDISGSSLTIISSHGGVVSDVVTDVESSSSSSSFIAHQGWAGLKMLQGLVIVGPDGRCKIEKFNPPWGLAMMESHSLLRRLMAEATKPCQAAKEARSLVIPGSGSGGTLQQGFESAADDDDVDDNDGGGSSSVQIHWDRQLVLVDTVNKQATFMSPGGSAVVRPYDLLIGADQCGGASLIASAMNELEQRKAAHSQHPTQHTATTSGTAPRAAATGRPASPATAASGGGTSIQISEGHAMPALDHAAAVLKQHDVGPLELEFKCWHDLPHQPELTALLPEAGRANVGPKHGDQGTADIQQGWVLLWTGGGAGSSSKVWGVPGGPCCSLMAWPNRSMGTWSGVVFAAPQVFESLRSQAEYEGLLQGLTADKPSSAHMTRGIPGLWIKTIAAQLKNQGASSVGRVAAPWAPVPLHLTSPAAGLLLLSPAAVPAVGPQLFSPGLSLGLEDGAQLTALVTTAVGSAADAGNVSSSTGIGRHVGSKLEACLAAFDKQRRPQAAALQQLEAQLSWLRHPFSPAAAAAAHTLTPGTLAWLLSLFGMTRLGLALQWRCLVQVLPLVAGVLRALGASAADLQQQHTPASHIDNSSSKADNSSAVLANLAKIVRPAGGSFVAFLHTAALPVTDIKQVLAVAPLLLAVLWGGVVFIAIKLVQWCMLAIRVWSYAHG